MSRPFSEFTGQFFWNFKRMDNVNYNFEIVELLYAAKLQNANDKKFNKVILILLMAIIECMLYDFLIRIKQRVNDPLPHLTTATMTSLNHANTSDDLSVIIKRIRSQNLMNCRAGDTLYNDLEHLCKVRNRLHIQNIYGMTPRDEVNVFTDALLQRAESCLLRVSDVLCNTYPRWNFQPIPMSDFPTPWAL